MRYEVIARRYRPRTFEEVVGQESVAQTLRGAILQNRLAHAYLFAGPRGVGKTSMARIFAKALNCPQAQRREGPEEEWARPCNACSTCEAIHAGQDIDVIEMDAASHRGIEDVRTILEGISRPATRSPFKVYIIDEVHMLTREAFNALLKTLEEPPPHVKFILATTEPHKIPETVLSRCQRFDFHPIREPDIVRRLEQIARLEGRTWEEGLLERIARYGRGGLRDAQTLLDQLITFAEDTLRHEDLDRITGRVSQETVERITAGVRKRDPAAVLAAVRDGFAAGADPSVLLEQVLEALHERLLALLSRSQEATRPGAGSAGADAGGEAGADGEIDRLIGGLQLLVDAATRLRTSAYPEILVEVALLKLARLEDPRVFERALDELLALENGAGVGGERASAQGTPGSPPGGARSETSSRAFGPAAVPTAARVPAGAVSPAEAAESPASSPPPQAAAPIAEGEPDSAQPRVGSGPCRRERLEALWNQIAIELQSRHPDVATYLRDARLGSAEETQRRYPEGKDICLVLQPDSFRLKRLQSARPREILEAVVRDVTGEPWQIRVDAAPLAGGESQSPPRQAQPSGRPSPPPGPARQGEGSLADHPLVRKSIDLFKGKLL